MLFFPSPDRIAGHAECCQGQWHASVDARLHQDSADFVLGYAVGKCAFDMNAQLMVLAHRGQHANVQQAEGLEGKRVIAPNRAPAIPSYERLQPSRSSDS